MEYVAINDLLAEIEGESGGKLSVCASASWHSRQVQFGAGRRVATASVIKLPILVAALRAVANGEARLDEKLAVRSEDKVQGSGLLQSMSDGLELPLVDVLFLMTVVSDNTATNLIIDRFGLAQLNRLFAELGIEKTTLHKYVFRPADPPTPDSEKFGLGATSAGAMVMLLNRLRLNACNGPELDALALGMLSKQEYRHGIPRFLPTHWVYAGKTGSVDGVRNDVGLVMLPDGRSISLAIFCQQLKKSEWTLDTPGWVAVAKAAKLVCTVLAAAE